MSNRCPDLLPDCVLLPSQFFAHYPADAGARRLCLAVFEGAVVDATAIPASLHTDRARQWLASRDTGPFSAIWISDHLGLDLAAALAVIVHRARSIRPIRVGNRGIGKRTVRGRMFLHGPRGRND